MQLSNSDLDIFSNKINSKIIDLIQKINPNSSVGLFYPYKNEVDVLRISDDLINKNIKFLLPKVISKGSSLKYFEYIYGKLTVVATNYPAHNDLPFSNRICFFENENVESFISSLKKADQEDPLNPEELESITLRKRAEEIFNFII